MNKIEVKVSGHVGNGVMTIASEIALALRLVGFKTTLSSKIKGERLSSKSQTKRVKELVASENIHITCEQLPRV